ncbi:O-antigen ligase [Uliginosibacterium sp. 31-12]|uniref:O-antigen ligase family protein n=1 Tax=Uliginosibacterium sp. 31-12 TaxID=3062781 RepID=UPI0026E46D62|nr:O-antigen ligase family protein [Uliginosibacterium sp. 31-12]MDO6386149.1 O-antigen ligase family protein [Uliginosibacterium sp. 31-12]
MQAFAPAVRTLSRPEFVVLALFAVALPLVEAPKNVFWFLFLVLWFVGSIRQRNFGQLARGWDWVFAALIVAPVASILNTAYAPQWKEVGDIIGYVSLGWMIARSRLDAQQIKWLLLCLVGATLLGALHGGWVMATDPKRIWLQLNSVGHVNHSALYGAGAAALAAAWIAAAWQTLARGPRLIGLGVALLMFGMMIAFASRGALIAYLFAVVVLVPVLSAVRLRTLGLVALVAVGLAVGAQLLTVQLMGGRNNQTVIQKTLDGLRSGKLSSYRVETYHTATEMIRQYPLTGVGAANFSAVSPEAVQAWVEARGEPFVRDDYYFSSHAHGLFTNTLGERGLLGISALLALTIGWSAALLRRKPGAGATLDARLCWGAGVAGWSVVFIGGLFNTTLHHEHGMLGMVCLGLLLSGAPLRVKAAA